MTENTVAARNAATELAREVAATSVELVRLGVELDAATARANTARDLYFGASDKLRRLDSALASTLRDLPLEDRLSILRSAGLGAGPRSAGSLAP
jgi:hypothetical protein